MLQISNLKQIKNVKSISNFQDWEKVTDGIYIYPISDKKRYEIHVKHWNTENDITLADAELYEFTYDDKKRTIDRKMTYSGLLTACVIATVENFYQTMQLYKADMIEQTRFPR